MDLDADQPPRVAKAPRSQLGWLGLSVLDGCNLDYMITNEALERVRGWFTGRLPADVAHEQPTITVDREEITVVLTIPDVE